MAPPPKYNQFPKTGKLKKIPSKPNPIPGPSNGTTEAEPSPEAVQQQFELEVAWCVQKLEESLGNTNLNQKQREDIAKSIKTLKSSNQPTVKKRMLMRNTFGDYRSKMLEEEKKLAGSSARVKFTEKATNVKSQFFKTAIIKPTGEDFKFNFPVKEFDYKLNLEDKKPETDTKPLNMFNYTPSDNGFRFNFGNPE